MKGIIFTALLALGAAASADTYVQPYVRSDGTYVPGHHRSSPNTYRYDNYSSSGNVNPYTGQRGYKPNEFTSPPAYNNQGNSYYDYNR